MTRSGETGEGRILKTLQKVQMRDLLLRSESEKNITSAKIFSRSVWGANDDWIIRRHLNLQDNPIATLHFLMLQLNILC